MESRRRLSTAEAMAEIGAGIPVEKDQARSWPPKGTIRAAVEAGDCEVCRTFLDPLVRAMNDYLNTDGSRGLLNGPRRKDAKSRLEEMLGRYGKVGPGDKPQGETDG